MIPTRRDLEDEGVTGSAADLYGVPHDTSFYFAGNSLRATVSGYYANEFSGQTISIAERRDGCQISVTLGRMLHYSEGYDGDDPEAVYMVEAKGGRKPQEPRRAAKPGKGRGGLVGYPLLDMLRRAVAGSRRHAPARAADRLSGRCQHRGEPDKAAHDARKAAIKGHPIVAAKLTIVNEARERYRAAMRRLRDRDAEARAHG
jgi:hypothetical protein